MPKKGNLFIVSGPSGAGKSTLSRMALDFFSDLVFSVSYTTRAPRSGETHGKEYYFVDKETFEAMVSSGDFLEYAEVHGKRYGTSNKAIEAHLAAGIDVLLDIDVQGAEQIRGKRDDAVFVFVSPPSKEVWVERLNQRNDLSEAEMDQRLKTADEELKKSGSYDHNIVNDDRDEAFAELKAVIEEVRAKAPPCG